MLQMWGHFILSYECEADLLQESYFGLCEAVQHYETSANVRFMTYAEYWIKQSVQRHLEKCGSTVRIPSHKVENRMLQENRTGVGAGIRQSADRQ